MRVLLQTRVVLYKRMVWMIWQAVECALVRMQGSSSNFKSGPQGQEFTFTHLFIQICIVR